MFQFGLQTEVETVQVAASNDLLVAQIILVFVVLLLITIPILLLIKYIIGNFYVSKKEMFNRATLLITLPKFRRQEESERGPSKEQVQEAISAAEMFFAAIGSMRAEYGLKTWLLGRSDEFSFEIVVKDKLIKFYITTPRKHQDFVEQQLSAAYPDAFIDEVEDYNIFNPQGVTLGSYVVFRRDTAFPIKTYRKLDKDPLNSLTNVLTKIPDEDGAAFQFMVRSSYAKWRKRGVAVAGRIQKGMTIDEALKGKKKGKSNMVELTGFGGESKEKEQGGYVRLSQTQEEAVKGLEEKASKAGMDVCVRLVVSSKTPEGAKSTMQGMLDAFGQYSIFEFGNSFVKVVPRWKKRVIQFFIHRGFHEEHKVVMNAEELASLWHLPLPWTETPGIKWLGARRGSVPTGIPDSLDEGDLELGYNVYRGIQTPVFMKEVDRSRHMYLIGKSGSGKTQTMANYILQDINAGHGVAVVEPHGDLIEQILGNIPKDRIDDVIVFNPSDTERPMGLNMLEAPNPEMRDFAVQEMISIFYKLFPPEMIGPMFEHQMRNFMLTLMSDLENPGTIAEIPRMVTDKKFQAKWRAKITDPVVRSFWEDEIDNTSDYHKSEMMGYLVSKVGRFVENEMMRNIIGQSKSSFDFRKIMDNKKILLVNLSKGKTGDVNAELLGLVIVSKLQMAALTRADIPESERHDFFLYIDEFQNFITDSIATILSEARKYRLNLIIAHQYIGQLVIDGDTKIKDAVFGNVGTTYVSRIGPEDVETLEKIYEPDFSGYDLINSDKYTWYVKMIVDNSQMNPFTMNLTPPGPGDRELAAAIKELSRLKYGRDKVIVAADILERTKVQKTVVAAPPPVSAQR
jgi:hypothetical protein